MYVQGTFVVSWGRVSGRPFTIVSHHRGILALLSFRRSLLSAIK